VKVYILIINYNSWQNTLELVNSVKASDYTNHQIVIIDNYSTDNSFKILKSELKNVLLFQTDKNGGFAYANNYFLKQTIHEDAYVWMLNPDTLVDKKAISKLVRSASSRQKTIFTTSIYDYKDRKKGKRSGLCKIQKLLGTTKHLNQQKKADYIYGASLFCHLNAFKEVGLFPEYYFLYWEETEWCIIAKKRGYQLYWEEEAIIYDKVSSLIPEKQYVSEYYYSLNALRFIKNYFPIFLPFSLCMNLPRAIYRLLKGQKKRTKAIFKATKDFLHKRVTPLPNHIN